MRQCRGVTLVELLVGLAVGAIVLLAVIAAWGISVRSASYAMESARLNHDLRSAMQIVSQDLRRADGGVNIPSERAVRFTADGNCVTYFVEDEPRGFRFSPAGEFQMYFNTDPTAIPTCDVGDTNWVALYENLSSGPFRITDFSVSWEAVCYPFDDALPNEFFNSAGGSAIYPRCDGMTEVTEVLAVSLSLTGEIGTGSGTKVMTVADTITVRNNDVR